MNSEKNKIPLVPPVAMGCSSSTSRPPRGRTLSVHPSPAVSPPPSFRQFRTPTPSTLLRIDQVRGLQRPSGPDCDFMCRTIMLGDSGVGKSSVSIAFSSNSAPGNLPPTVGVDIVMKTIEVDNTRICFQMFDPAGHEKNWIKMSNFGFLRSADVVLVMFDVSNQNSFASCSSWLDTVKTSVDPGNLIFLVGNKIDCTEQRVVSQQEAEEFARQKNIDYYETSAASQIGISELFNDIAYRLLEMPPLTPSSEES